MARSLIDGLFPNRGLRSFAFSVSVLVAACSGDEPNTAVLPDAGAVDTGAKDGASSSRSDADASVTPDAGDTRDAIVTADPDATAVLIDAEAGAQDANRSDGAADVGAGEAASESGPDSAADGPHETAASDAHLDVDLSGGTVLLLGGGASTVLAGEFHPGSSWLGSTLTDATDDRPAVALTSASSGMGVLRSTNNGGEVRFTSWSPGTFSSLTALGSAITTRAAPSAAGSVGRVDLVFQGDDFKHYFARHGSAWSPTAETIGDGVGQSFGPTPASIALLGADSIVAFAQDGSLVDRSRVGGLWQAVHMHDLGDAGNGVSVTPAIVAPTSGPELLIAFVRSPDQDVFFATRTAGTWTTPQAVGGGFSADPVALVALAGGDVLLVLRATDSHPYWTRYAAGAWSGLQGFPWANVTIPSTPSLAPGVTGAEAEIAFVDSATGAAMHARLNGSTWSQPVTVGGAGLTSVSIASAP